MGMDLPRQVHFNAEAYAVGLPAAGQEEGEAPKVEHLTDMEREALAGP